jgi:hypothetical protein
VPQHSRNTQHVNAALQLRQGESASKAVKVWRVYPGQRRPPVDDFTKTAIGYLFPLVGGESLAVAVAPLPQPGTV